MKELTVRLHGSYYSSFYNDFVQLENEPEPNGPSNMKIKLEDQLLNLEQLKEQLAKEHHVELQGRVR